MRTALDDIKFLVNSPYRVTVLTHLAESPTDRQALHEETEIPQSTLGRILEGFQERGWIERDGADCRITRGGRQLATDFANLESNVERSQKLQLVEEWLPEEFDVDLTPFADAEIVTPRPAAPLRPIRRYLPRLRAAASVRGIAPSVVPEALEALREGVTESSQALDLVVTPDVVDVIGADAELRAHASAIIESDTGRLYRAVDAVPSTVLVVDEALVVLGFVDAGGRVLGAIESDSESVRTWAAGLIEGYLEAADRLVVDDFTG